jgi:hypothetical protein
MRIARVLSAILALLVAVAAAAGLWIDGLYQDPDPLAAMYRGYDLIALLVVAPLLAVTLLPSLRHRTRVRLVWTGLLAFCVYNYALYVFGTAFSAAFLVHVAIFTLAVYALVLALAHLDVTAVSGRFSPRTPVRVVGVILLGLGVSLGAMWVVSALRFAVTGEIPVEASRLTVPITTTHLGYVLDLSLLVPAYVLAAVLLWRRAPWGYVLAPTLLVAGTLQQVGYMTALLFQTGAGIPGASAFDPAEPVITLAYVIAATLLLANVRDAQAPDSSSPIATVRSTSASMSSASVR